MLGPQGGTVFKHVLSLQQRPALEVRGRLEIAHLQPALRPEVAVVRAVLGSVSEQTLQSRKLLGLQLFRRPPLTTFQLFPVLQRLTPLVECFESWDDHVSIEVASQHG